VSDPRAFYRFINSKQTDTTSIPPIKSNNKVLLTDIDKAQCLNNYFGSVFTVEDASISISTSLYPDMPDIQVTTPGVLKLLSQLDVTKSMGPYTAIDSNKLDKVQRRAARFVRRDYQRTTSASQIISELGWQSLAERQKTSRLTLLYKAIHGLVAIPMDELEHTSRCTRHCGPDAFIILQSRVDAYKFSSFFPRTVTDWNSLPSSARSTPSVNYFKTGYYATLSAPNQNLLYDILLNRLRTDMDISIKISILQSIIIAKSAKNILNLTCLPVNNMANNKDYLIFVTVFS